MSRHQETGQTCNEIYENLPCHDPVLKMQQPFGKFSKSISVQQSNDAATTGDIDSTQSNGHYAPGGIKLQQGSKKRSMMGKEMIYATPLRKSDRGAYKSSDDHRNKISGSSQISSSAGMLKHVPEKKGGGLAVNRHQGPAKAKEEEEEEEKLQRHQLHRKHYLSNGDDYHLQENNNNKVNRHHPITDLDDDEDDRHNDAVIMESTKGETVNCKEKEQQDTELLLPLSANGDYEKDHHNHHHQHHQHHHHQHHQHQQHHYQSQHQQLENHRILNFLKDTTQLQKRMENSGRECLNAGFSNLAREEHFANLVQQNFSSMDLTQNSKNASSSLNKVTGTRDERSNKTKTTTTVANSRAMVEHDQDIEDEEEEEHNCHYQNEDDQRNLHDPRQETADNLEVFMQKKLSPDKEVNGFIINGKMRPSGSNIKMYINREWVLKKIALCLEQRATYRKSTGMSALLGGVAIGGTAGGTTSTTTTVGVVTSSSTTASRSKSNAVSNTVYNGCLVLGSNGSGKTSICQAIMNGNSGTKGLLNRKLLASYLIESQNPECHSLSMFIRKIILQILSHSSLINRDNSNENSTACGGDESLRIIDEGFSFLQDEVQQQESKLDEAMNNLSMDENAEDILIAELKKDAKEDADLIASSMENNDSNKKDNYNLLLVRQRSEPEQAKTEFDELQSPEKKDTNGGDDAEKNCRSYGTHPPKLMKQKSLHDDAVQSRTKKTKKCENVKEVDEDGEATKIENTTNVTTKYSPSKKSKIPVKLGRTTVTATSERQNLPPVSSKRHQVTTKSSKQQQQQNQLQSPTGINCKTSPLEKELKTDENKDEKASNIETNEKDFSQNGNLSPEMADDEELSKEDKVMENEVEDIPSSPPDMEVNVLSVAGADGQSTLPPPLPKNKNCRTVVADGYYEMLISNPDIFEHLNVDNIEKNPDECFKKAFLFPLLELTPPRGALLLLIDSIDENYINEGNLVSTLKYAGGTGRGGGSSFNTNNHRSRNVAELLSNHIHLFPKWLFLVCTTKKQMKPITKMFTGFKKITLDDLRKSHVVKDVQEYIINRLNTDFKDSIMLTKEIIESLHQLYIKSNGCILYLEKVLNGIKENFFSFREIKLIPCTLNGLYLYICQKSFNKKQYMKIRPILNILLASTGYVEKLFVYNCLRTYNYSVDLEEFEKRLHLMRNVLQYDDENRTHLKIFHNSFSDWLVDVKFATKKFICDVNEGHVMISMYYLLVAESLCATTVRRFIYHLLKADEYLNNRNVDLDLILMLLESRLNLNDCFYTNHLNCCTQCETEFKNDPNFLMRTRNMIERFLNNELSDEFSRLLCDFFKPTLPTDSKILKLLIESGINNADTQNSVDSASLLSPELLSSENSQNIDFELADLLLASEKSCLQETQRLISPKEKGGDSTTGKTSSNDVNAVNRLMIDVDTNGGSAMESSGGALQQLTDSHRLELHKGKALIHILANDGNHQLLERALNACKGPIDLEIEDYNGQTALNIAARNGHLEIVKLLLNFRQKIQREASNGLSESKRERDDREEESSCKIVDVNHADRDGWTPLRSASWGGHFDVVKMLIAKDVCKIDLADKEGRTALRAAAWSGHEDILKVLIEHGADVNSVDRQGRTSLIAASYMGHYDIVEILLDNGADVNHLDLDGRSALCVAALCGSAGYNKVISTLLEHGANTDQLDNDGMSPLLVSSFEGNAEVCELLLENGADPDLADFMGRTPLWAACTAGHAPVVRLLLFWGCGIDCMDSEGRTVLSIAAAQGNVESVRQLLDRGLDETHRDNAGWTPLHYAAFEGFHEVCQQLLDSGAKIDECDNEGKTALHLAAQEGRIRCLEVLLETHPTFVDQKAHDGKTAFRLACLEGHLDCVQYLQKYHCDVNSKDADSRTTLYILALENKLDMVKYLLEYTNVGVNIPDSEGRTALHVAAWQGHTEMVKMLITMGNADVNAMDLEARTPLHSCAWQGNHDVMNILLYFGALADHSCNQGATALGISAQEGHDKCVMALLHYRANPYKSDHCGRTPIKLAAKSNRTNILKIFDNYTKNEMHGVGEDKPASIPKISNASNAMRSPVEQQTPNTLLNHHQQQQYHQLQHHQCAMVGSFPQPAPHTSALSVCSAATTATVNNSQLAGHSGSNNTTNNALNASSSTHSSNNFYQNTMQSDCSSLQKRKSVISSQSTGSSNDAAQAGPAQLTFTQQLQRQSKLNSRNNPFLQNSAMINPKQSSNSNGVVKQQAGGRGGVTHKSSTSMMRHAQVVNEFNESQHLAGVTTNEADLHDMDCMSPLYATPPHSPSSDLSSPGQLPFHLNSHGEMGNGNSGVCGTNANATPSGGGPIANGGGKLTTPADNHFARDTHMRIILGNLKENQPSSSGKSKRSGITTNPAVRLIRSRFDSAAQLIRRTNNILSNSSSNQGSSSIGVKSGTFQWRKESQM